MDTPVVEGTEQTELFPTEPAARPWALTPTQIRDGRAGVKAARAALRQALETSGHTTVA